jgi:hypothetical protein
VLNNFELLPQQASNNLLIDIELWEKVINEPSTTALTKSILETVIFVGKQLQHDKVLLLTSASSFFIEWYTGVRNITSISSVELNLEDDTTKFTLRWLLQKLIQHLDAHMVHKCIHRRFGTILYKHNGYLLSSLSLALGSMATLKQQHDSDVCSAGSYIETDDSILTKSSEIIGRLLQKEIA